MMKGRLAFLAVLSILALALAAPGVLAGTVGPRDGFEPPHGSPYEPPDEPPTDQEPPPPLEEPPDIDPGRPDESRVATPNLSFPVIMTTVIDTFYQQDCVVEETPIGEFTLDCSLRLDENGEPIPIVVDEVLNTEYPEAHAIYDPENPLYDDLFERDGLPVYHTEWVLDGDGVCPLTYIDEEGHVEPQFIEMLLKDWDILNEPWFPQPIEIVNVDDPDDPLEPCLIQVTTDADGNPVYLPNPNKIWDADCVYPANSWQADWIRLEPANPISDNPDPVVYVDVVDIADVLESTLEWEIGKRLPISIALYERIFADYFADVPEYGTLTSYDMSLLENMGGDGEWYGTADLRDDKYDGDFELGDLDNDYVTDLAFASVLTTKFEVWVEEPDGHDHLVRMDAMMGSNGNMTLKVGGEGFVPSQVGIHKVSFMFNDPLIDLQDAVINNIANYVLPSGCQADVQDWLKDDKEYIVGNTVVVFVNVVENRSGGTEPPVDEAGGNGGSGGNGGGNGTHSDSVRGRR